MPMYHMLLLLLLLSCSLEPGSLATGCWRERTGNTRSFSRSLSLALSRAPPFAHSVALRESSPSNSECSVHKVPAVV
uniref:Putative secreted protein n=1 Tax=Anopheles darlingi TaxID=43151 RepID=A0A2M4D6Y2_ANODA